MKQLINIITPNPVDPNRKVIKIDRPELTDDASTWALFFELQPQFAIVFYERFDQLRNSREHDNLMEGLARYYAQAYGKLMVCIPEAAEEFVTNYG